MSNCFDTNILSSSHINFLFGAGVNGKAFPQLKSFTDTLSKIEELGGNIESGLESGIDSLSSSAHKKIVKDVFIKEFMEADAKMNEKFGKDMSLINLEKMLRKTYLLVNESQNRNPSMKQINIFTLNYDQIVEKTLSGLGYFFSEISASNTTTRAMLLDVIGYNFNVKKYVPTFMVSKLHGDIDNPIIPGKSKYQEMLNEDYFEIAFNMKEKLCRQNSILIVIGYSGRDEHINKILKDCLNAGLTIYWYKFAQMDIVPFEENNQIIVRQQEDYSNPQDTTANCYRDMEQVWEKKLEE
ncbi:putative uncharacterized protein [Clostridium sp. CAG:75]|jgi:hypothetical protein|nr:putative uncharacterized protein [Clostridium sp. CAG:75]